MVGNSTALPELYQQELKSRAGRYENNLTRDTCVDFHIDFMLVASPVVATKY